PGALDAQVTATGSVSFGYFDWPHEDDAPVTQEITYSNAGEEDTTLALRVDGSDDTGGELPAGVIELTATAVTVPAGGQASVQATVDPALITPATTLSGYVVASSGEEDVVRTGWGVVKE